MRFSVIELGGFPTGRLWNVQLVAKSLATTSGLRILGGVGLCGLQAHMLVESARFQVTLLPPDILRESPSVWQVPCCRRLPVPPVLPMLHSPLLTLGDGGSVFAASCVADLLRGFSTKVAAPHSNMMTDVGDCQSHLAFKTLGSSAEYQV